MHIVRIEVENFKSYKGHQVIGPFKDFTAIIGPNGSGKSNLMDAMSFVLGVQAQTLRSGNLKDLIYRVEGEPPTKRTAQVKLVFDSGKEIINFSRTISVAGKGEYRIDNKAISEEQYTDRLKQFNILVKARNFLVFQGDVESIASKSPKELTHLIEQVSGSDELKKEYEEAQVEKERAEENIVFSHQKKKGISAEKKQYKEQKEEADRFQKLCSELNELKLVFTLWQLFHIDKELTKHEKERASAVLELGNLQTEQTTAEKEHNARKKEHGKVNKEYLLMERRLKQQHDELESKRPNVISIREKVAHLKKRINESRTALDKGEKDYETQKSELDKIDRELKDVLAAQTKFEADYQKLIREQDIVPEAQVAEYNKRKAEAGVQTAQRRAELETISRQQKVDTDQRDALQAKQTEIATRLKGLEETEASLQERQNKVQVWMAETQAKISELKKRDKDMQKEEHDLTQRQAQLSAANEEVQAKLQEMKSDRKETERDQRMNENLEALKRLYPNVLGRVIDLCKVSQNKFNVAVTVAMGAKMDAVVVQDEKTAMECIQYMKEQRVGIATFLPLDTLKAKPLDERLRQKGRLVTDVLNYDPAVSKAVQYACGNILLCETLDEAKRLCFGRERNKAVTVDGTLIEKSGLMTGGLSGIEARAKRWNEKQVDELKRKRDATVSELQDIARKLRNIQTEQQVGSAIEGLESRLKFSRMDGEMTAEKLKKLTAERATLEAERTANEKELNKLGKQIQSRVNEIDRLTQGIREVEEKIFADFSKAAKVKNIREYEETKLKRAKEYAEKRVQFAQQVALLQNHAAFERARDLKAPVNKLKQSIAEDEQELAKEEKKHAKAKEQETADEQELADFRRQVREAKGKVDELEAELKELKKRLNVAIQRSGSSQKRISAEESSIEQMKTRRHNIFHRCKVEEIRLPLRGGGELQPSDIPEVKQTAGSQEPMEIDQGSKKVQDREDEIEVDFDKLSRKQKELKSAQEYEEMNQAFISQIQKLATDAEQLAPNMKAVDRLDNVMERLKQTTDEFDDARKIAKAASDKFYAVKQDRVNRFMEAFNHISEAIDKIYKELTKSDRTAGGTAYLSLENKEEPFSGGIKYNAMPPMKRFRDMDQLSGGEQTVAALALLFAVHSFQKAPFFILDEIDAALDNENVAKVVSYIRRRTRDKENPMQCLVISLKESFFALADALVGVCRDQGSNSSRTLAIDVNALAATAEATPRKTRMTE